MLNVPKKNVIIKKNSEIRFKDNEYENCRGNKRWR